MKPRPQTGYKQIVDRLPDGNAAERAYAALREAILSSLLKPGDRLLADDIAKELNISKTPVREALRKLQAQSLVVERGSGLVVRVISEEELFQIYSAREALEGMAARLATQRIEPAEIGALRAIVAAMKPKNSAANSKTMQLLTRQFFATLLRSARNAVISEISSDLRDRIRQFPESTMFRPDRPKEVMAACKHLLAAIEKRDADEAERLIRAHRKRTLELRILTLRGT